jgi:hypothetical protein
MENMINSGDLKTLKAGETLLVQAIATTTDKIQLEFAEVIQETARGANILAMFNASDDRFSQKARRAWMTVQPGDAEKLLNLPEGTLTGDEGWVETTVGRGTTKTVCPLNVLNPTVEGNRLVIQIVETNTPTEWQALNIETAAKRRGKDGAFITHNGKYIFSNESVVFANQRKHIFLESDSSAKVSVDTDTGEIFN